MPSKDFVDQVIEPRWLLPIAPANIVLTDHAVAVTEGRIVAVGPRTQIDASFEARERVVRPDHALTPGLVNAHTRAATTLLRGLPVYGPRSKWMRETVRPIARSLMSPDFVRDGTQLAIAEMLRAGITAFADMYLFPEETARAASAARMRAAIGLPVTEGSSVWAESATGHLAKAEQLWDEYRAHPAISLYFAPHDVFGEGDQTLMRVRRVADELDARVAMYVAPDDSVGGRSALARLREIGLLGPGFTAIQLGDAHSEDLEIAATTGICVVGCQQSHLRLRGAQCPVGLLEEAGVNVGLGTDSALSVGALDMLAEARVTALLTGLSAENVLRMATLGSATAIGMGSVVGSIEPGKAADLVCWDLSALASQTSTRPADSLIFAATRAQASDVWLSGRAAVREGHLLTFDEQELRALARRWAGRITTGATA